MGKPANTAAQIRRFGVFEFDAQSMELRRAGVPIKLREQPSRILAYLLEHAGRMVTREELRQLLWPADTFVDFDHSLNTAVMTLRVALGDSADKPLYIETLPKKGYRFVAAVSSGLAAIKTEGERATSIPPHTASAELPRPPARPAPLSAPFPGSDSSAQRAKDAPPGPVGLAHRSPGSGHCGPPRRWHRPRRARLEESISRPRGATPDQLPRGTATR
jgi:DNA-binding winged helix-turn-helix (wHTH) protein